MPELPEVETVKNALEPQLIGRQITRVTVTLPKIIAGDAGQFAKQLTGQSITGLSRRGKYLTIHLQSGDQVVLHLRMTGCLTVEPAAEPTAKHTHLTWTLDNQTQLRFADLRQFGKFWYQPRGSADHSGQQKLGPEPTQVTADYLQQKLTKRQRAIKTLLLDQSIVAGIGNIYSDEICFRAGILPTTPGCALTTAQINQLTATIPAVITQFIAHHHVSFAEYAASRGTSYQNDAHLQVYGRAGQPCLTCGTTLTGARLDGRSTVYCPTCQH